MRPNDGRVPDKSPTSIISWKAPPWSQGGDHETIIAALLHDALEDQRILPETIATKLIKLADKISNLRAVATSPPVDWSKQRRRDYIEFCAAVVDELRGISPLLEAEFDAAKELALLRA
jgi:(p)ppGpp synthase/HD superfamily hydrolase